MSTLEQYILEKKLSRTQAKVFKAMFTHYSNKDLGTALHVVEKTIKYHKSAIFKKTGYKSTMELIRALLPMYREHLEGVGANAEDLQKVNALEETLPAPKTSTEVKDTTSTKAPSNSISILFRQRARQKTEEASAPVEPEVKLEPAEVTLPIGQNVLNK